jgi:hypothetical protein
MSHLFLRTVHHPVESDNKKQEQCKHIDYDDPEKREAVNEKDSEN